MRLQSYLNEADLKSVKYLDAQITRIKSKCKPWLGQIKSNPYAILRGMRGVDTLITKKVRTDRKPLDTYQIEHEEIDKAFYDAFGWKPRSAGVFVTPDPGRASAYGNRMVIVPIGKVKYLWSKDVNDLYFRLGQHRSDWLDKEGKSTLLNYPPEEGIKYAKKEQIFKLIISKYQETMISSALNTRTEIMISCKEYYAIPGQWCIEWLMQKEFIASAPELKYKYDKEIYKQFMKEALLK